MFNLFICGEGKEISFPFLFIPPFVCLYFGLPFYLPPHHLTFLPLSLFYLHMCLHCLLPPHACRGGGDCLWEAPIYCIYYCPMPCLIYSFILLPCVCSCLVFYMEEEGNGWENVGQGEGEGGRHAFVSYYRKEKQILLLLLGGEMEEKSGKSGRYCVLGGGGGEDTLLFMLLCRGDFHIPSLPT